MLLSRTSWIRVGVLVIVVAALFGSARAYVTPSFSLSHEPLPTEGVVHKVKVGVRQFFKIEVGIDGQPYHIPSSEFGVNLDGVGEAIFGTLWDYKNGTLLGEYVLWNSPGLRKELYIHLSIQGKSLPGSPLYAEVLTDGEHGERSLDILPDGSVKFPSESPGDGICSRPGNLTVVTASTGGADYLSRLGNLVGSLHVWEPAIQVVIYGLELSPDEAAQVKNWRNVEYRAFHFDADDSKGSGDTQYAIRSYAFKPIVIHRMLREHACVMWIDAGIEIRQPLNVIRAAMDETGYYFVTNGHKMVNDYMPSWFVQSFGLEKEDISTLNGRVEAEIATGQIGIVRGSSAHVSLIEDWYLCARDPACFEPENTSRENFRQDQSVLNIFRIVTHNESCLHMPACPSKFTLRDNFTAVKPVTNKAFWAFHPNNANMLPDDELTSSESLFMYIRRNHEPKPYIRHLRQRPKFQVRILSPKNDVKIKSGSPIDIHIKVFRYEGISVPKLILKLNDKEAFSGKKEELRISLTEAPVATSTLSAYVYDPETGEAFSDFSLFHVYLPDHPVKVARKSRLGSDVDGFDPRIDTAGEIVVEEHPSISESEVDNLPSYTIWQSDMHVGPARENHHILTKLGMRSKVSSLSKHCWQYLGDAELCDASDLPILNVDNAMTFGDEPELLREQFYSAMIQETQETGFCDSVDLVICSFPPSICEAYMSFNKSMIVDVSNRFEMGRQHPAALALWKKNFAAIARNPENTITSKSRYDQHYTEVVTGVRPILLEKTAFYVPPGLYQPRNDRILLAPYRLSQGGLSIALEMRRLARRKIPHVKLTFFKEEFPIGYTIQDLAQYPAAIAIPYSPDGFSLRELYALGTPIFAPTRSLLSTWEHGHELMTERVISACGARTPCLELYKQTPHPNRRDILSVYYWMKYVDLYHWPHVILFDSIEDLFRKLVSTDLMAVSSRIKAAHKKLTAHVQQEWSHVVRRTMKKRNGKMKMPGQSQCPRLSYKKALKKALRQ